VAAALHPLDRRPEGLTPPAAGAAASGPTRVLVLVPARDEAAVVGSLVADLAAQDALDDPAMELRIVVVDDASTDGTGAVIEHARAAHAHRFAGRMDIVRTDAATTKGGALQAGLEAAAAAGPTPLGRLTSVVVLDADARIDPTFLRRLIDDAAGRPATARRRMLRPPDAAGRASLLAELQDDEQTVDVALRRLRGALGGVGELRGDGMVVPLAALRDCGGMPVRAVCEDLELSTALAFDAGLNVVPSDVEVWEQPVLDAGELIRQRLRWAEGAIRRDLRLVWPRVADRRVPRSTRLDAAAYAAQTLVGPTIMGLWLMGGRGRRLARAVITTYAVVGASLAAVALRTPPVPTPDLRGACRVEPPLVARVAGVTAFGSLWLLVTTVAWLRIVLERLVPPAGRAGGPPRIRRTPKREGFSAPWDAAPAPVGGAAPSDPAA
jgi:1,2-diacylglycerol 3-beta-glucosyltransferase